jgi:dCTP deaminase
MILKSDQIANLLRSSPAKQRDRLIIRPQPDLNELEKNGAASIDLRLGTWFISLRHTRFPALNLDDDPDTAANNAKLAKSHFVPFGTEFVLQPHGFVLGVTLEWVRLPANLAGYVVGRSSWGRRGLIIATAAGVHPGFTGCLTLELSNVGEIPIAIKPGIPICQLFLHDTGGQTDLVDESLFVGLRRPSLGKIKLDDVAKKLAKRQPL